MDKSERSLSKATLVFLFIILILLMINSRIYLAIIDKILHADHVSQLVHYLYTDFYLFSFLFGLVSGIVLKLFFKRYLYSKTEIVAWVIVFSFLINYPTFGPYASLMDFIDIFSFGVGVSFIFILPDKLIN